MAHSNRTAFQQLYSFIEPVLNRLRTTGYQPEIESNYPALSSSLTVRDSKGARKPYDIHADRNRIKVLTEADSAAPGSTVHLDLLLDGSTDNPQVKDFVFEKPHGPNARLQLHSNDKIDDSEKHDWLRRIQLNKPASAEARDYLQNALEVFQRKGMLLK